MTTSMALTFLGRILFGLYFMYSGYNHFKHVKHTSEYAKMKGVPMPREATLITGLLMILGGLGFFLNVGIGASAVLLLVFMVPTTFIMHQFWKIKDPAHQMGEKINFLKNLALIGSLLMLM